jgi:hypothetical protein
LEISRFSPEKEIDPEQVTNSELLIVLENPHPGSESTLVVEVKTQDGFTLGRHVLNLNKGETELRVNTPELTAKELEKLVVDIQFQGREEFSEPSLGLSEVKLQASFSKTDLKKEINDEVLDRLYFNQSDFQTFEKLQISNRYFDLAFPENLSGFLSIRPNFSSAVPALNTYPLGADIESRAERSGGTIRYRDALPDTDFEYSVTEKGFKEFSILKSEKAPQTLRYLGNFSEFEVVQLKITQLKHLPKQQLKHKYLYNKLKRHKMLLLRTQQTVHLLSLKLVMEQELLLLHQE